jgi:hypothetical protein
MRILLAWLVLAMALPRPGLAADVVFPPGSRIGLAPPADMQMSKRFTGFENPSQGAAITLVEMPPEAFRELSAGFTAENLKSQGLIVKSRETLKLGTADALLVTGDQTGGAVSFRKWLLVVEDPTMTALVIGQLLQRGDADKASAIPQALKTVAIRPPRGIEEQLAALPFRLGERAGFRPVRVMAGNSVLLTDGPKDVVREMEQPLLVVAQSTTPAPRENRDGFARAALLASNTFKDVAIERSQSFRQRGADWHEIVARATDIASGRPVVVTQTLRFAQDHYLRMFGIVRAEIRDEVLSRFRAVADSVEAE